MPRLTKAWHAATLYHPAAADTAADALAAEQRTRPDLKPLVEADAVLSSIPAKFTAWVAPIPALRGPISPRRLQFGWVPPTGIARDQAGRLLVLYLPLTPEWNDPDVKMVSGLCGRMSETVLRRYPRLTAHMICESLGYCTPSSAARILWDAHRREQNHCEWIASCYRSDPLPAARQCWETRRYHRGFMADYRSAKRLVDIANQSGAEPLLASWF